MCATKWKPLSRYPRVQRYATATHLYDLITSRRKRTRPVPAIIRAIRPKQWIKNVLVIAGPLAAAQIFIPRVLLAVLAAFIAFSLCASSIYLLNDVIDVEADRAHPVKRNRPIASGDVSIPLALIMALALFLTAVIGSILLGYFQLAIVLVVYTTIQVCYCLYFKHMAVFDLFGVTSGFVLRAVAGGLAAGIYLSPWFLLVTGFGSLFMVAGKRYSELRLVGKGEKKTRKALDQYSLSYLRFVWTAAATGLIVFYCLWAVGLGGVYSGLFPLLSIIPFVIATMRYAVDMDRGVVGEPETVVLGDKALLVLGFIWLVLFGIGATVQ